MKIGILGHGLVAWRGGIGFAALIANALVAAGSGAEIHLFLPLGRPVKRSFPSQIVGNVTRAHDPAKEIILDAFATLKDRVTLHVIDDGHDALQVALHAAAIDAALPAMSPLPPAIGVPWAGYIYDFQHRYLPDFFTEEEIRLRDTAFLETATTSRAVVNSKKVKSDISKFIPEATAKVFAMPFAPFLDPNWMLSEDEAAEEASAPYFIICNQFRIHKDHGTAIRAFAKIAKDHPNVNLVCTGFMNDYRAPDCLRELRDEIDQLGINSRVKLLGMVPKAKQMRLGNPNELAQLMRDLLQGEPRRRPDSDELLKAGTARLVRCGSVLLEALAFVRQGSHQWLAPKHRYCKSAMRRRLHNWHGSLLQRHCLAKAKDEYARSFPPFTSRSLAFDASSRRAERYDAARRSTFA